ncbi:MULTISPECIES: SDR family NAD(P)-dependent oxidoreductase [Sphingomonas]|uniref:SDR family NAD(P)-dependent oxidoreductase n=1 Tax=Sphingomonas TaxID=13687 RepID=UPI00083589C9|nr:MULTISPECIES: SDR family NAD(P)-dependent oxidoreductase [Sphingomonas]MBY0303074.1 SDR family NAD(P)-dependent oxidoreductase [Sphingomonas ginsenosidimutans]
MTVLVTGGAGFIGCHLCEVLVARGERVVALDNLLLGRRTHLSALEGNAAFAFVEGDATDPATLDALFAEHRFDAVFHLAANSDIAVSHADPGVDFDATFRTSWAVLDAMRRHGTPRILFASTSAVYGEATGAIREDHGPLLPISHYGAAKLASEAFISSFVGNYGIRAWIARFPNVVGDRSTHGAIHDFARKLAATPDRLQVLGDGSQIKPYLHVDDLVDALLLAWETMDAPVNLFNVGGTTRCSVRRMAEIVVEEAGGTAQIAYTGGDRGWIGDVPSVDYDTTLIRSLGWSPRLDSEGAVRAAARWALHAAGVTA